MNEVEIKFAVDDVAALESKLRELGFRLQTPSTHELNTCYDFPNGQLRKRGELLRLRKYGSTWTLTHKAPAHSRVHKARIETETQVSDGEKMDAILQILGLKHGFRYEKFRAEWSDGRGHVVIDQTPIGKFAEIEGEADWIDRTAAALAVSGKQYITVNYAQLFDDWRKRTGSGADEMTFKAIGTPLP